MTILIDMPRPDAGYETLKPDFLMFNGGEEHVNLPPPSNSPHRTRDIRLRARIKSAADVIRLLLVTDTLRRAYCNPICLVLPYVPFARQDRVCEEGDAFSMKVFANLVNAQGYDEVLVADAHSPVATALIDRCGEWPQHFFAADVATAQEAGKQGFDYVLAPDAGAAKKAHLFANRLASVLGQTPIVVQALKTRSPNGHILSTEVLHDDFKNGSVLLVDDICDGGRTFIEIAKALKEKNAGRIELFVTHGIFSQGVGVLWGAGIGRVYTTDSWYEARLPGVDVVHRFFDTFSGGQA